MEENIVDSGDLKGPLDPLLDTMRDFTTNEDLHSRIMDLYERIDLDESGGIDLDEFNFALKKLPLEQPVQLTVEDYDEVTELGRFCNEGSSDMSQEGFESMMMSQVCVCARACKCVCVSMHVCVCVYVRMCLCLCLCLCLILESMLMAQFRRYTRRKLRLSMDRAPNQSAFEQVCLCARTCI